MDNNNNKANWIRQFDTEHGRIYISDKGAIKITQVMPGGEEKFIMCLQPRHAETLVNISGDLGNVLNSPEYKQVLEQKQVARAQQYVKRQTDKQAERALLQAQAAFEKLQSLGVKFEPKVG